MACTHVYASTYSPICACNVSVANETRYDEFEGEMGGFEERKEMENYIYTIISKIFK